MNNCQICDSEEHLTGKCEGYNEWIKKPHPDKKTCLHTNIKEIHTSDISKGDLPICCKMDKCLDCGEFLLKDVSIGCNHNEPKENNEGSRKYYKNLLFRFKEDCYKEMVILDSELSLTNTQFNKLFEDLINKFRKKK